MPLRLGSQIRRRIHSQMAAHVRIESCQLWESVSRNITGVIVELK